MYVLSPMFLIYIQAYHIPRFIEDDAWRKDFGVDDLVKNFDYKEKAEVFAYYPQYYHKTDKVRKSGYEELIFSC
jgi:hypothetical protein